MQQQPKKMKEKNEKKFNMLIRLMVPRWSIAPPPYRPPGRLHRLWNSIGTLHRHRRTHRRRGRRWRYCRRCVPSFDDERVGDGGLLSRLLPSRIFRFRPTESGELCRGVRCSFGVLDNDDDEDGDGGGESGDRDEDRRDDDGEDVYARRQQHHGVHGELLVCLDEDDES